MRLGAFVIAAFASAWCVAPAGAEVESTNLFRQGSWYADINYDTVTGDVWCDAGTYSDPDTAFWVLAFDTGEIGLMIRNSEWELRRRSIEFLLDVDYSRWTITGLADGQLISVAMSDPATAARFLGELSEGSTMALYNLDERRLAVFSLAGSRAALGVLMECWKRIDVSDPFRSTEPPGQTQSDPF